MAHEISIQNGRAEMFSGNNVVPWHGLGTVVAGLLEARDALAAAHLDWDVGINSVHVGGKEVPGFFGTVRMDTGDCLGIVKGRYEIIQNKEAFDFLDVLTRDGEIKYETAGALRGGRLVWMLGKYDGELTVNGDSHRQWMLCVTSHDGSKAIEVMWVTERVVCANTLSIALRGATNVVKIRHTANWQSKEAEARRVLGLTRNYFTSYKEACEGMDSKLLTAEQMQDFSKLLLPSKPAKAGEDQEDSTRLENIRTEINTLFGRGAGNQGSSRWDAMQAVSDYADHSMTIRGKQSSRLESATMGAGAQLKQKAFDLLTNDDVMGSLIASRPFIPTPVQTNSNVFADLLNR